MTQPHKRSPEEQWKALYGPTTCYNAIDTVRRYMDKETWQRWHEVVIDQEGGLTMEWDGPTVNEVHIPNVVKSMNVPMSVACFMTRLIIFAETVNYPRSL